MSELLSTVMEKVHDRHVCEEHHLVTSLKLLAKDSLLDGYCTLMEAFFVKPATMKNILNVSWVIFASNNCLLKHFYIHRMSRSWSSGPDHRHSSVRLYMIESLIRSIVYSPGIRKPRRQSTAERLFRLYYYILYDNLPHYIFFWNSHRSKKERSRRMGQWKGSGTPFKPSS